MVRINATSWAHFKTLVGNGQKFYIKDTEGNITHALSVENEMVYVYDYTNVPDENGNYTFAPANDQWFNSATQTSDFQIL